MGVKSIAQIGVIPATTAIGLEHPLSAFMPSGLRI
jgi:hypothetical protein